MPEDLTGKKYGLWTVLKPSDKKYYFTCQCGGCGKVKEVNASTLRLGKSHGCLDCTRPKEKPSVTKTALKKAEQKAGQMVNGWLVIEVLPEKKNGCFLCRAICPKCKKETEVPLTRLHTIAKCSSCAREILVLRDVVNDKTCVDGSRLPSVKARVDGTTNKNSSSKVNGVSKLGSGRYRAYITFRRKQYHIGTYDTVDDAAAARKEVESVIYGKYLSEHEGWEEDLKQAIAEMHKK